MIQVLLLQKKRDVARRTDGQNKEGDMGLYLDELLSQLDHYTFKREIHEKEHTRHAVCGKDITRYKRDMWVWDKDDKSLLFGRDKGIKVVTKV